MPFLWDQFSSFMNEYLHPQQLQPLGLKLLLFDSFLDFTILINTYHICLFDYVWWLLMDFCLSFQTLNQVSEKCLTVFGTKELKNMYLIWLIIDFYCMCIYNK